MEFIAHLIAEDKVNWRWRECSEAMRAAAERVGVQERGGSVVPHRPVQKHCPGI